MGEQSDLPGRSFVPLEKGWGGECEILAWGFKQRSDIALVTSCPCSLRPLRKSC